MPDAPEMVDASCWSTSGSGMKPVMTPSGLLAVGAPLRLPLRAFRPAIVAFMPQRQLLTRKEIYVGMALLAFFVL